MRISTLFPVAALLAPLAALAAPLARTLDSGSIQVLQFAFVLENLETQFYDQALKKFQPSDFVSAGFESSEVDIIIQQITIIQQDEFFHVTGIQDILTAFGQTPMQCQFDFSSVLKDVSTMVSFAQLVENVGVGAYLGAAHLIGDPRVLTAAASIVTIEARHQSVLNLFQGIAPVPQPFDIPLLPNEVLALAGPLIKGCDLGIKPNSELIIINTVIIVAGVRLEFSSSAFSGIPSGYHCQMLVGGLPFSIPLPMGECVVPEGINGPVAIWITSDEQPLNAGAVDRQSNAIIAGPAMTFIDSPAPDAMSELFRKTSGSSSNSSDVTSVSASTTTVTPPEATSMIMSAMSVMASDMAASASASASVTDSAAASASATDSASASASVTDSAAASASATDSASASATDSASASASATASAVAGVVFSMVPMPSASA